jgi:apolipoprotein N-acyltransferase
MLTRTDTSMRASDRLSYLWLAGAAVLTILVGGQWNIPLAAWLAPLFLLRFVRTQRPLPGLLLAWLVRSAAVVVFVHQGILSPPGSSPNYTLVLLIGSFLMLPYLADRLMTPRLQGFVATFVFPLAFTTVEYLASRGPNGTITSTAYTQYGDLPLMQLVSVTGIWGITFVITWFAAVVNWAWERDFALPKVRNGGLLYAAVLVAILMGGSARLALFPPSATTVRVAGLSASQAAVTAFTQQLPQATLPLLLSGKATAADRAAVRTAFAIIDDDLLNRTQQEARAGAKIVAWPEASSTGANILEEDRPALLQRAGALAKQESIYLELGLGVYPGEVSSPPLLMDEAVLIDPTGNVAWTYEKTHPAPGDPPLVPSDGEVPLVDSPYGRLGNAICFDLDFPSMIRQAGRGRADLFLGPSDDWQAQDPVHAQHAAFRAIENGFSLVRQASRGLSISVDYEGRVLAASDYYTTDRQVMVADVPTHGVATIYATIGDLFAWLCVVGLLGLIGLAILQGRRRRSAATTATPVPEPQLAQ